MEKVDFTIIGGGCAGLFTAREIVKRDYSCAVFDRSPYSQFSSTRNQGWLQSGALYAIVKQFDVAEECAAACRIIKELYPEAIRDEVHAYFLFDEETDID